MVKPHNTPPIICVSTVLKGMLLKNRMFERIAEAYIKNPAINPQKAPFSK